MWICGEEKHLNQWHLCENHMKGRQTRRVLRQDGRLPGAAVLNWEMGWDWDLKRQEKGVSYDTAGSSGQQESMLVLLPNVPENDQRGLESWKAVL